MQSWFVLINVPGIAGQFIRHQTLQRQTADGQFSQERELDSAAAVLRYSPLYWLQHCNLSTDCTMEDRPDVVWRKVVDLVTYITAAHEMPLANVDCDWAEICTRIAQPIKIEDLSRPYMTAQRAPE